MKTIIFWLVIVAATVQPSLAQIGNNKSTQYGLSLSRFSSQSGFQPGYDVHFTVQPNHKAKVGFGLFIDNETQEFAGLTITHERFLFSSAQKARIFQPFIVYNFIYRKTTTLELIEKGETIGFGQNWVTYTSLEHHLGIGIDVNISNIIYLDCSVGYGLYLGSIKHPSNPDPITREISGTSGSGLLFKTGFGFRF